MPSGGETGDAAPDDCYALLGHGSKNGIKCLSEVKFGQVLLLLGVVDE